MNIPRTLLAALATALIAAPSYAASTCYTPDQIRAEQLLRLHSELMVITAMCRQGSTGENLSTAYGDFTKKNITVLHNAEQTMIAYYKEKEKGDPQDKLDQLRTRLGNEYGQKAANQSAPAFCAAYRDEVLRFDAAAQLAVETEVRRLTLSQPTYEPPCPPEKTVVAKKGN